jgi:hypothetical protein
MPAVALNAIGHQSLGDNSAESGHPKLLTQQSKEGSHPALYDRLIM